MADTSGAVLIAEIGSLTTRVTLVDIVDGESRMIGRAETVSSVELPYQNALYGVLEAAAQLSEATGRLLLRDGQLIMPQTSERDGINQFVALSSAAGNLALVITAIAGDVSARSALHASRGTYTSVLQVVTLDDAVDQPETDEHISWIERQVQALLSLQPDAVLIAGGLEGGAVDAVGRLAHIVGLTAVRTSIDTGGQQRQNVTARPVIYAGNSNARERVLNALSDRAKMFVVENVRPALDRERLEPVRQELGRLYDELILARMPGLPALRRLSRLPVMTVCGAAALMTRFLAERFGRRVLALDVGGTSSSAFLASPGSLNTAVLGVCGTGYGLTEVMSSRGVSRIAGWLPFAISDADLIHRLLNKVLRPQLLPASREDLYIEHAVAREAMLMACEALADQVPALVYNMVVIGGGVLAHAPHPGMAALIALDALQPTCDQGDPLLTLHLDSLSLLPACGALAALDADAAVSVFDHDALRNSPLATCVVALGDGKAGDVALEAELIAMGGRTQRVTVRHGQIVRLPLDPRSKGQLVVRPAAGVRIGDKPPGVELSSHVTEINGSALGVVIDARGRPLRLAEDPAQRQVQLWEWLVALGAERGQSPYVELPTAAPPVPEVQGAAPAPAPLNGSPALAPLPAPAEPPPLAEGGLKPGARISLSDLAAEPPAARPPAEGALKPGSRISLSDLAAQSGPAQPPPAAPAPEPPAPPAGTLESDLAKLRQQVEEPKKKGWFGRKK